MGRDGICDIGRIRQRTDLRSKEVQNIIQNILALDAVSLHNILDIQFAVEGGQIILLIFVILQC